MQKSILSMILNLVKKPEYKIKQIYKSNNRANNLGDALEEYIKDLIADTVFEVDDGKRLEKLEKTFSYLGNSNNPPDIIIRNGDAIEIKKIQTKTSTLQLNSSYPKAKLFANSTMLTQKCKECETWVEKDILYAVGVVNENRLASLSLVYGTDYAASPVVYERIKEAVKDGVKNIQDVEFAETQELGRVNKVDPLGITYLRIRGMWLIENPFKTFRYVYTPPENSVFDFMAIINSDKYESFSEKTRKLFEKEVHSNPNLTIKDVKIKTPDNPVELKNAKLITFFVEG